jgi:hypothetical protein
MTDPTYAGLIARLRVRPRLSDIMLEAADALEALSNKVRFLESACTGMREENDGLKTRLEAQERELAECRADVIALRHKLASARGDNNRIIAGCEGLRKWKEAALFLGEGLSNIGPDGYYSMTPSEWLSWVSKAIDAARGEP